MTDETHETDDGPAAEAVVTEVPAPTADAASSSPNGVLIAAIAVLVLVAVAAVWFLSGDGDGDDGSDPSARGDVPTLDGRRFTVTAITAGGEDRRVIDLTGGGPPVVAFADGRVSVSGCNDGSGPFRLDVDRLVVDGWGAHQMACVGAPVGDDPGDGQRLMDQDTWFATFFQAGPTVAAYGDDVTLTAGDDVVRLTPLAEPEPVSFWGNRWELDSIGDGATATSPASLGGDEPEVVLDTTIDGQVAFTACNRGSGPATIEGERLVVTDYATTEMACTDPGGEARMALDATMATFLGSGPAVAIEGDQLTLSTETTTVTFRRLAAGAPTAPDPDPDPDPDDPDAPSLPDPGTGGPVSSVPTGPDGGGVGGSPGSPGVDVWGSAWRITELCDRGGSCGAPLPTGGGSAPVLGLTTDGQVGFDGCNGGGADATLATGADGAPTLDVGPVVSTKMACGGPDGEALMAQDAALAALLEAGPIVAVQGDQLTLTTDDAGSLVATRQP